MTTSAGAMQMLPKYVVCRMQCKLILILLLGEIEVCDLRIFRLRYREDEQRRDRCRQLGYACSCLYIREICQWTFGISRLLQYAVKSIADLFDDGIFLTHEKSPCA